MASGAPSEKRAVLAISRRGQIGLDVPAVSGSRIGIDPAQSDAGFRASS